MDAQRTTMSSPATATATSTRVLATTPAPFPPLFMYSVRPRALDAELFSTELAGDEQGQNPWRFRLECPNGNSHRNGSSSRTPEEEHADEQCHRAGLFPAEVYADGSDDFEGGVWVGTFLPVSKTWRCSVTSGDPATMEESMSGRCSSWEGSAAGASTTAVVTSLDQCDVIRQRVPVIITAGNDAEYNFGDSDGAWEYFAPPGYNSFMIEDLSWAGCSDPTSLVNFAAATTTATSATSAASGTAAATAESAAAASRGESAGSAALVCVVLACAGVVAGLLPMPVY